MDEDQAARSPSHADQRIEDLSDANTVQTSQTSVSALRPSSPLPEMLPDSLRKLLHTWYEEHGISAVPPCATTHRLRSDPFQTYDGAPAVFINDDGQEMHAKRYSAGISDKTVLAMKCRDFPASIIKHWRARSGEWPDGWYAWRGGELWDKSPSVRKIAIGDPNDTTQPDLLPSGVKASQFRQRKPSVSIARNADGYSSDLSNKRAHTVSTTSLQSLRGTIIHLRPIVDPILPAELSPDNIRETRTRSDQAAKRICYAEPEFYWPKKRKNHAPSSNLQAGHEASLGDTVDHIVPHLEADRHVRDFDPPSAIPSVVGTPTERNTQYEKNQGVVPPSDEVRLISGQAQSAILGPSSIVRPAISPAPISLPSSRPSTSGIGSQESSGSANDISASSRQNMINQTTAAAQRDHSRGLLVNFEPEPEPELQAHSSVIDLTSDEWQSKNDEILTRHIEKHASMVFLPQPSERRTRIRAFEMCNSLGKLFAQAYQAGLFAQEGGFGRLLELKIRSVDHQAMGVAEGDKEDFVDFVQSLKNAPVWKMTENGVEGDCKVEVRLQTLSGG